MPMPANCWVFEDLWPTINKDWTMHPDTIPTVPSFWSTLWKPCHSSKFVQTIFSPGPWFNIKMSSYQNRKSHCGDKTILQPSYLHNGISYIGKMTSLYWISPLVLQLLIYISIIEKGEPGGEFSLSESQIELEFTQENIVNLWPLPAFANYHMFTTKK